MSSSSSSLGPGSVRLLAETERRVSRRSRMGFVMKSVVQAKRSRSLSRKQEPNNGPDASHRRRPTSPNSALISKEFRSIMSAGKRYNSARQDDRSRRHAGGTLREA